MANTQLQAFTTLTGSGGLLSSPGLQRNTTYVTGGRDDFGDGGGAFYYYDPASSETGNGSTVEVPTRAKGRLLQTCTLADLDGGSELPALTLPTAVSEINAGSLDGDDNSTLDPGDLVGSVADLGSLGGNWAGGSGNDQSKPMYIADYFRRGRSGDVLRFGNFHQFLRKLNSATDFGFIHKTCIFHMFIVIGNHYLPESDISGKTSMIFGNAQTSDRKGFGAFIRHNAIRAHVAGNLIENFNLTSTDLQLLMGSWHVLEIWGDGSTLRMALDGGTVVSQSITGSKSIGNAVYDYLLGSYYWQKGSTPQCWMLRRFLLYDAVQATRADIVTQLRTEIAVSPKNVVVWEGDSTVSGSGARCGGPDQLQAVLSQVYPGTYTVANRGVPGQKVVTGTAAIPPMSISTPGYIIGKIAPGKKLHVVFGPAGINDLLTDVPASTVNASLASQYAQYDAVGAKVYPVSPGPVKGYGLWSAARQQEINATRSFIINSGRPYVDAFSLLEDESTANQLSDDEDGAKADYVNFDLEEVGQTGDFDFIHDNSLGHKAKAKAVATRMGLGWTDLDHAATDLPEGGEIVPPDPLSPADPVLSEWTLRAWWTPRVAAQNFTNDAATTIVATSGDRVAVARDADRSKDAIQTTNGFRPYWRTGVNVVTQSGVSVDVPMWQFVASENTCWDATVPLVSHFATDDGPLDVFVVLKGFVTNAAVQTILAGADKDSSFNAPVQWFHITQNSGPGMIRCGNSAPTKTSAGTFSSVGNGLVVVYFRFTGTTATTKVDDQLTASADDMNASTASNIDRVMIGILSKLTTANPLNCYMGDLVVGTGNLTDGHAASVIQYLHDLYSDTGDVIP